MNYNYFKILHFSSGLRKIIFMILIAHREHFIPNVLIDLTQIAYSFLFLKFGCHLVVISNASIYTIVPVAKPLPLIGIQLYLIFTFLIFLWLFIQNKFWLYKPCVKLFIHDVIYKNQMIHKYKTINWGGGTSHEGEIGPKTKENMKN